MVNALPCTRSPKNACIADVGQVQQRERQDHQDRERREIDQHVAYVVKLPALVLRAVEQRERVRAVREVGVRQH